MNVHYTWRWSAAARMGPIGTYEAVNSLSMCIYVSVFLYILCVYMYKYAVELKVGPSFAFFIS